MSRSLDSTSGRESPASAAHFSFTSPMMDVGSHLSATGQTVPPFEPTDSLFQLSNERGSVTPEIHAKIDKGFFRADQDWTCYRRNYFSVACSYALTQNAQARNEPDHERMLLIRQGGSSVPILGFYMCISAKVDGEDGKPIELVQHTPKRDKGPMTQPERKELKPNPSGNLGMCTATTGFGTGQSLTQDYDSSYLGSPQDSQNIATFERIQFKKATANNGKRRAAQQYFHIVVELYAKVYKGKSGDTEYVKIAHRVSAQMVVRGRSPGHYQDERRSSSTNMGPGSGSGGDYGAHPRDQGPAGSSLGSHTSLNGPHYPARLGHGGYQTHHSAIGYSTGAASPLPSSVQPSLNSSFDQYVETLPSTNTTHAERQGHADNSSPFQCYNSASFERGCPVSRPPVGPISLSSSATPSSDFENPASYATMSTIKEEPCSKRGLKTEENPRLGGGHNPLPLPAFEKWINPAADSYHPPRDCRTMQLDTNRSYYASATPAAW
ncbi:hypothetical protein MMC10_005445 [Thelotrema lepadinum]|nr:hypothetical protein [Thelotrema lepadinum]